ncbi:MAG: methyltransferase domain-containing protein [Flavobacterium sp.]|nr:methyltransferase domain-containing protein [Flavobacterium sp.]RZJ67374.1 MAG: methyltransferase domain-containing protein [Flavobacterium sp.]
MTVDTTYRSEMPEIMDDLSMQGKQLRDTLDKIAGLNRTLGGNRLTLEGIKKLIKNVPLDKRVRIMDVGCGNGDMLRDIADYGDKSGRNFSLVGIDANFDTIKHAEGLSKHYPDIAYACENIFDDEFEQIECDVIVCTLTLHHFSDEEIEDLLRKFNRQSSIGIVINDLHRSAIAYRLFQLVCFVFGLGAMPKNDGLISILRGFKKSELRKFSKKLNFNKYSIRWKWAFRYQWIISTL